MSITRILICMLFLAVSACSKEEPKAEKPRESTILKAYTEPLEKAKGVEQTLQDAVKEKDQLIDQQSQ